MVLRGFNILKLQESQVDAVLAKSRRCSIDLNPNPLSKRKAWKVDHAVFDGISASTDLVSSGRASDFDLSGVCPKP